MPDDTAIDWKNPTAIAIDGFTVDQIIEMLVDSVATARCSVCNGEQSVEPDARDGACSSCGAIDTVTSPLIKLGLV